MSHVLVDSGIRGITGVVTVTLDLDEEPRAMRLTVTPAMALKLAARLIAHAERAKQLEDVEPSPDAN